MPEKLPRGRVLRWSSIEGGKLPSVYLHTSNGLDYYVLKFTSAAEALELANFIRGAVNGARRASRVSHR
jgi:hypothetical protein